jgi:hypothetical protein
MIESIPQTGSKYFLSSSGKNLSQLYCEWCVCYFWQLNAATPLVAPDSYPDAKQVSRLGICETGIAISTEAYYF